VENLDGGEIISGDRADTPPAGEDSTVVLVAFMTEVAANEEVSDEPAAPGVISTPVLTLVSGERILAGKDQQNRGDEVSAKQTGEALLQKLKIADNQQRI